MIPMAKKKKAHTRRSRTSAIVASTTQLKKPPAEPPEPVDVVAVVQEALALLHDAPERLVIALRGDDLEEVLSVISCIYGAIGELRRYYDDRPDRFLEGRQRTVEDLVSLRTLAWRTSVRIRRREVES
jgi:hypothetical protein